METRGQLRAQNENRANMQRRQLLEAVTNTVEANDIIIDHIAKKIKLETSVPPSPVVKREPVDIPIQNDENAENSEVAQEVIVKEEANIPDEIDVKEEVDIDDTTGTFNDGQIVDGQPEDPEQATTSTTATEMGTVRQEDNARSGIFAPQDRYSEKEVKTEPMDQSDNVAVSEFECEGDSSLSNMEPTVPHDSIQADVEAINTRSSEHQLEENKSVGKEVVVKQERLQVNGSVYENCEPIASSTCSQDVDSELSRNANQVVQEGEDDFPLITQIKGAIMENANNADSTQPQQGADLQSETNAQLASSSNSTQASESIGLKDIKKQADPKFKSRSKRLGSTPQNTPRVIGIDFGTTSSSAAVFQNGKVEMIASGYSSKVEPKFFRHEEMSWLIGDECDENVACVPETLFGAKRFIGRKLTDPSLKSFLNQVPFTVAEKENKPQFLIYRDTKALYLDPEAACSKIIAKLKSAAAAPFGVKVDAAVITVPSSFNYSQRQMIRNAAENTSLHVVRLLSDSTAAALHFGLKENILRGPGERNVLTVDIGGCFLGVSVVTISERLVEVRSTSGDYALGGDEYTGRLTAFFIDQIKGITTKDVSDNKIVLARLRNAAERAIIELSETTESYVRVPDVTDDYDFCTTISRTMLELLCADLFRSILVPIKEAIRTARMSMSDIHDVVLSGGSANIPMVQNILRRRFNGIEMHTSLISDEPVVSGAAIYASMLSDFKSDVTDDLLLVDVTPCKFGIRIAGGHVVTMVSKNKRLPLSRRAIFTTCSENQTVANIMVYESENGRIKKNKLIGILTLIKLPPAKLKVLEIKVTFRIDTTGILTVSAYYGTEWKEMVMNNLDCKNFENEEPAEWSNCEIEPLHENQLPIM